MKIKRIGEEELSWKELKDLATTGKLLVGQEINFELKNGTPVTVIVRGLLPAESSEAVPGVRFVFKTAVDRHQMNKDWTNKGGYWLSEGRRWLLEEILPQLPDELVALIRPRKIVENLSYLKMEYQDQLWMPCETDLFGRDEDESWQEGVADGPDDFQLPGFLTDDSRVVLLDGRPAWAWLRSVSYYNTITFLSINTDGTVNIDGAYYSGAVAPGFDF